METKWLQVEVKAVDADARTVEGMASTMSPDYGGDVILPKAWKASLKQWKKLGSRPKFLAYHKHSTADGHSPVIGKILEMKIMENGLWFKAEFAPTILGEEHLSLYAMKAMDSFSVGFMALASELEPEKIAKLLGKAGIKTEEGAVARVITQAHLLEVSCVVVGMNAEALTSASTEAPVQKMLERLEKFAGIKIEEGKTVSVDGTETALEGETFDFEEKGEDVSELGPTDEEPEYSDDPLEEKDEEPDEESPDITGVLRDLVDVYKSLKTGQDELKTNLEAVSNRLESLHLSHPAEAPAEPIATEEAMSPAADLMKGIGTLRKDLQKLRGKLGLA